MALDFPSSPTVGQIWPNPAVSGQPQYTWDGEKWTSGTGFGNIYIADTAPAAPVGSLWWESDTGLLYVRYNDGTSTQWVIACPQPDLSTFLTTTAQSLTQPQQTQARQNIYAAPFDAMMGNNILINGAMDISQMLGQGGSSSGGYIADQWIGTASNAAATFVCGQAVAGLAGFANCIYVRATTAMVSLAAGDYALFAQYIEGVRFSKLGFGGGGAQPVTVGFWVNCTVPGTATLALRTPAGDRSYVANFAVTAAATWQWVTITIPGDVVGTWPTGNVQGATLIFCFAAGTNWQGTNNSWSASNFMATPQTTNFFSAAQNQAVITGVVMLPGVEAPSAARSPFIMRSADQELVLCQRYYQKYLGALVSGYNAASGNTFLDLTLAPNMRIAPAVSFANISYANASGLTFNTSAPNHIRIYCVMTAAGAGYAIVDVTCDARF